MYRNFKKYNSYLNTKRLFKTLLKDVEISYWDITNLTEFLITTVIITGGSKGALGTPPVHFLSFVCVIWETNCPNYSLMFPLSGLAPMSVKF